MQGLRRNPVGITIVVGTAAVVLAVFGKALGWNGPAAVNLPGSMENVPAAVGAGQSLQGTAAQVDLGPLRIDGRGDSPTTVVGNGGWVVLDAGYSIRFTGAPPVPRMTLERRIGSGTWTTTTAQVSHIASGGFQVRTPSWATSDAATTVSYRLVSTAFHDVSSGGVAATTRSSPIRVRYENQSSYSGLAAEMYQDAAPYCPSTAVHVGDLTGDEAGLFGTGSQLITIDSAIETSMKDPIDLRAVALHECSHERQWMNYGGTDEGRGVMERAAAGIFSDFIKPAGVTTPYLYRVPSSGTIKPIEHAADCGAQAMNPGGYLGYGGYCSSEQLDAGRRLLLGGTY